MIYFNASDHTYRDVDSEVEYISATTLISKYKQPFDAEKIAVKAGKNSKSKWFNIPAQEIVNIWMREAERANLLGNWYHDQREKDISTCTTITKYNKVLPVFTSLFNTQGKKISSDQHLEEGIYPEHMVYLKQIPVCGQSDLVEIADSKIYITDYKTSKEIKERGYKNWEGIYTKMLYPLSSVEDCNLNHYTLQLSLYMYIILRNNPLLRPGELKIHHISFEQQQEKDKYGFPLLLLDDQGQYIIKDITIYKLPYLRDEVHNMIKHFNETKK